jgi:hypothetical protein
MEASYRLLHTFGTWPKDIWRRGSAFITCLQTIQPYPSTEAWNLALYSGHLQPHTTIPFPTIPSASSILNSILVSLLNWHFFAECVGCYLQLVLSSPISVTLMKETLSSSETSVLTRATRGIPEGTIFTNITYIIHYNLTNINWNSTNNGLRRYVWD